MDPLDSIVIPEERVSAHTLEIPIQDRSLFEQLRNSTKITDISDEIAFNKYLRILLQREFEKWSHEGKVELVDKIIRVFFSIIELTDEEVADLSKRLMSVLPSQNLTVAQSNQIRRLLETSGKLAEQHKKITEGMTINVNVADPGVIQKLLIHVIYPCVDRDGWERIKHRCKSFAPIVGQSMALDLGGDDA